MTQHNPAFVNAAAPVGVRSAWFTSAPSSFLCRGHSTLHTANTVRTPPRQRPSAAPRTVSVPVPVTCSMRPYLESLVTQSDLTAEQTRAAIDYCIGGEATDAEIAALVALVDAKGETAGEVSGVVASLREKMVPIYYADGAALDIVGTGGDGANIVNISAATSIVAAAVGCRVAKHRNLSVSSKSGSADVLQALGIELSFSPEGVYKCIEEADIAFMFAPNHHPVLGRIGPIRKALKIRTVFNIVGPSLNPCSAKFGVIGVYKPELLDIAADVLIAAGVHRAVVVHTEGLTTNLATQGSRTLLRLTRKRKDSTSSTLSRSLACHALP